MHSCLNSEWLKLHEEFLTSSQVRPQVLERLSLVLDTVQQPLDVTAACEQQFVLLNGRQWGVSRQRFGVNPAGLGRVGDECTFLP